MLPCWKNHQEPNDVEVWWLVGEHDQASSDGQHDKYEGPVLENNIYQFLDLKFLIKIILQ